MSTEVQTKVQASPAQNFTPAQTGLLQKKSALCNTPGLAKDSKLDQDKLTLQRSSIDQAGTTTVPPIVHEVLRSPGVPLDPATRAYMEPRFGHDFSRVRVHADARATESARAVDALAYTVGHDVVFNKGQYAPRVLEGRRLMAHELTHVLQQPQGRSSGRDLQIAPTSGSDEREADNFAHHVLQGDQLTESLRQVGLSLARFTVRGHHIIEEAALAGAGFSDNQREAVHRGNLERDFSQVGRTGNTLLLCDRSSFGGYSAPEHFDNFIWDAVNKRWRSRGTTSRYKFKDVSHPDHTPIDYVENKLKRLAQMGMNEESLVHLGNAFHTIEDFFAHSNFVELINKDFSFGKDLVTGSVGGSDYTSVYHILASVSAPVSEDFFRRQAEADERRADPLSHTRMTKDQPSRRYHEQARQLAALVIQNMAGSVRAAMKSNNPKIRMQLIEKLVLQKVRRYLRPPRPADPWWQKLKTADAGAIDRRIEKAERRTPETVGQCVFSPLGNLEASRLSSMHIPLGVAVPVAIGENQIWLQAGFGVIESQPLPLDRSYRAPATNRDETPAGILWGGVQITGTF